MKSEITGANRRTAKTRPRFWKSFRRVAARIYLVVGGLADILGIYGFGESRNWWNFTFTISPETQEVLWMLALGVGGPWTMMLAGIGGAKLVEIFTGDREATRVVIISVVRVGSFFAIWHCAQMTFDIKIFPRYLSGDGFITVVGAYLLLGLAVGTLSPIIVYTVRRIAILRRGGQPRA
jgi:hypothetical protein